MTISRIRDKVSGIVLRIAVNKASGGIPDEMCDSSRGSCIEGFAGSSGTSTVGVVIASILSQNGPDLDARAREIVREIREKIVIYSKLKRRTEAKIAFQLGSALREVRSIQIFKTIASAHPFIRGMLRGPWVTLDIRCLRKGTVSLEKKTLGQFCNGCVYL